jgi:hypothetical protein
LIFFFLFFPHVWVPAPHHPLQAQTWTVAAYARNAVSFLRFTPDLISGDLSHQLTHRFFLLKLHSLLSISPQTEHPESPQAARILARKFTVPASSRDKFGEHSPSFDL